MTPYYQAIAILAPAHVCIGRLIDDMGAKPDAEIPEAVQEIRRKLQALDGQLAQALGVANEERRRVPPQSFDDAMAEVARGR